MSEHINSKPLKVLSLFDGISCARLALSRAGFLVDKYYASEIDKDAIQVTQQNFPDTIQLGDVTKVNFEQFKGKIDIIFGGSPCQDLSICKTNREGLKGKRSSLFYYLADAIKTIKPKYFLVENVASMSKENKQIISEILGVEPILINSSMVCAQQRKRLYWTNIPDVSVSNFIANKNNMYVYQILEPDTKELFEEYCINAEYAENITGTTKVRQNLNARVIDDSITEVLESIDYTKSRLSYIPDKIFSDKSMRIGNMRRQSDGTINTTQESRVYSTKGKSVSLCAGGGGWGVNTGLYAIDLPNGQYYIRKLTPLEAERLQTLPDNYTNILSKSARYKVIGNCWTVDVIAGILKNAKF